MESKGTATKKQRLTASADIKLENSQQSQNNRWSNNRENYQPPHNNQTQSFNDGGNRQQINQVSVERVEEKGETSEEDSSCQVMHAVNSMTTNHRNISPYIQCEMESVST